MIAESLCTLMASLDENKTVSLEIAAEEEIEVSCSSLEKAEEEKEVGSAGDFAQEETKNINAREGNKRG